MKPTYFRTSAELRRWFAKNHAGAAELLVGFHKAGSGTLGITWPESVDEALCVGWIDGVRKRVDDRRYTIRFTPRRAGSIWSAVNIRRVAVLTEAGRMKAPGLAAFAARVAKKSAVYAYEQEHQELDPDSLRVLRRDKSAWKYFDALPRWYRHRVSWWVMSAKRSETRASRLAKLVEACAEGRRL